MIPAPDVIAEEDLLAPARERLRAERAERAMSIGEWADVHVLLPRGDGPVRHQQEVTPYFRHWHALTRARITGEQLAHDPHAHLAEIVLLICAAQLGKTAGYLVPTIAWITATRPRDLAVVLPSDDARKKFAKDKIAGVFTRSPRLDSLLPVGQAAREKRMGGSSWRLDRSSLYFLNGAVALDLRSRDLPLMLLDEFDALPVNVDKQGSPLALALERQKTFPRDCLMGGVTTPTFIDSHGWKQLCAGSHERLLIACRECGAHQWLDPDRLEPAAPDLGTVEIRTRDAAVWRCYMPACKAAHTTDQVHAAVTAACAQLGWSAAGGWCPGTWSQDVDGRGHWTPSATADAAGKIAGFVPPAGRQRTGWLNSLYSRVIRLGQFLAQEREVIALGDTERQSHWNNWRCEPWVPLVNAIASDEVERVAVLPLSKLPGYQHGQLPVSPARLVLSLDQQGSMWERSWFPYILRGWNADGESWLVSAGTAKSVADLDLLVSRAWPIGGASRQADRITIDSANGPLIRDIRKWCAREPRRRMSLAGSGSFSPDAAFSMTESNTKNAHRLCGLPAAWHYNADLFRDDLYNRVRAAAGVAGWHVPSDAPDFYRASLTSEERVVRDVTIRGRREMRPKWQKRVIKGTSGKETTREDNHWWDCETQNLAAVTILGWIGVTPRPPRRLVIAGRIGS